MLIGSGLDGGGVVLLAKIREALCRGKTFGVATVEENLTLCLISM